MTPEPAGKFHVVDSYDNHSNAVNHFNAVGYFTKSGIHSVKVRSILMHYKEL